MAMSLTITMQLADDDGSQNTPRPRRSTREKRASQQFSNMTPSKRKRVEAEAILTDVDMPEADDEDDDEDDYEAPRKFKPSARRGGGRGRGRGGGATPTASRRPRVNKIASDSPTKPKTSSTSRHGRKAGGASTSGGRSLAEAKIQDDNALFNAIMNPAAALQTTVEDFLESFQQSEENALSDLINCVLRSCGSNDSVDADRAVDYDGIVDALDDFTEALKVDEAPTYPLTSKHPMFKRFRKSLSEFLTRLIASAAEMDILYTSDLLMTIQAWVVAMSSSQLRSFRHTATVIALEIETALCDVAAAIEKEAETLMRQREGEKKRKANNKSGAGMGGRDKVLEKKSMEVKERRTKLAELLKEFFDGVFIHRYRDLDPHIRAECVSAMGSWLRLFPAHFLDGQYLRYIGWVLSDTNTSVRVEAVRSLVELYKKQDYIVSLQSFTERFKGRLIEMARADTDLSVRVVVINVLGAIDNHGLLEDDQRAKLCLLIFDADARVRKAVAGFVRGVWTDATETRLVGKRNPSDDETKKAGLKALAKLLLQWGRALERESTADGKTQGGDESSESQEDGASPPALRTLLASPSIKSRLALATEALWNEIEVVSDWEAMLDLLQLDHSALGESSLVGGGTPVSNKRRKGKKVREEVYEVDECWRLEESEETTLLECLLATISKAKAEAISGKKSEAEMTDSDITRALIKALPSLITKHQTDAHRIHVVLQLTQLMNIEMYLEMRMISAYETLWDDITKQFLTHTSPTILATSVSLISTLLTTTSLGNTNSTKIAALEESLATSLRDLVGGREELEIANFEEDEARKMGDVLARMATLNGARDLTEWTEEEEGGNQSCAWDIVVALAERGRLGYREEEVMVERAMHFLMLHVIWKARRYMSRNITGGEAESEELEVLQDSIREQRDALLDKLVEYALGTQSNTLIEVRRAAFEKFLTLYILFSSPTPLTITSAQPSQQRFPLASLALTMSDELQYRCTGFVQAEIERYIDELPAHEQHQGEESGEESGSEPETPGREKATKKVVKSKKTAEEVEGPQSKVDLQKEYIFSTVLLCFLRGIRAGVVHIRHATAILAYYGRLGVSFDLSVRLLVDILREEGMYKGNGSLVVEVVAGALKQSQAHLLERLVLIPDSVQTLAKALVPALLVRGAQLAVVRKLPAQHVIDIHSSLITWATKEILAYISRKNKKALGDSIGFFKALQTLSVGLEQADAMVLKEHLKQQVKMLGLDVPTTAKVWEPFRSYERKLTNLSTKEKVLTKRSPKSKSNDAGTDTEGAAQTSDDEDVEVEDLVELSKGVSHQRGALPAIPTKQKMKSKPVPAYRSAQASRVSTPRETERDVEEDEGEKSQTRSSRSSEIAQDEDSLEHAQRRSNAPQSLNGLTNGNGSSESRTPSHSLVSPSKSLRSAPSARKRARSPDLDEDEEEEMSSVAPESPAVGSPRSIVSQSEAFVVKKKRVRH